MRGLRNRAGKRQPVDAGGSGQRDGKRGARGLASLHKDNRRFLRPEPWSHRGAGLGGQCGSSDSERARRRKAVAAGRGHKH